MPDVKCSALLLSVPREGLTERQRRHVPMFRPSVVPGAETTQQRRLKRPAKNTLPPSFRLCSAAAVNSHHASPSSRHVAPRLCRAYIHILFLPARLPLACLRPSTHKCGEFNARMRRTRRRLYARRCSATTIWSSLSRCPVARQRTRA